MTYDEYTHLCYALIREEHLGRLIPIQRNTVGLTAVETDISVCIQAPTAYYVITVRVIGLKSLLDYYRNMDLDCNAATNDEQQPHAAMYAASNSKKKIQTYCFIKFFFQCFAFNFIIRNNKLRIRAIFQTDQNIFSIVLLKKKRKLFWAVWGSRVDNLIGK